MLTNCNKSVIFVNILQINKFVNQVMKEKVQITGLDLFVVDMYLFTKVYIN